ncbi:hypothetical protein E2562_036110 [Oryza meyeriana var. granulata]|uniref:Uncharacterized protein n=1 Tax=Oryza meyeriana var. granulata TaxID=110450 RepID=A0A6G1DRE8_9ORYZ|nr:hypothetical protein E2562_036110 [Oryza meyeriana var. granulata]
MQSELVTTSSLGNELRCHRRLSPLPPLPTSSSATSVSPISPLSASGSRQHRLGGPSSSSSAVCRLRLPPLPATPLLTPSPPAAWIELGDGRPCSAARIGVDRARWRHISADRALRRRIKLRRRGSRSTNSTAECPTAPVRRLLAAAARRLG